MSIIKCYAGSCIFDYERCCFECEYKEECNDACDDKKCRNRMLEELEKNTPKKSLKERIASAISVLLAIAILGVCGAILPDDYEEAKASAKASENRKIECIQATEEQRLQEDINAGNYEDITELKEPTIEEMIVEECDNQGIDSTIPVAISKLETGHYTSDACMYKNNVGGISLNEVPVSFSSKEEGVNAFVTNLSENYYRYGLDTVDKIAEVYCPLDKEHWSDQVKQLCE